MLTFISDEKLRERMEALGEIVRIVDDLEPDLVTFQEVTHDNLAVLQEERLFWRYHLIPLIVAQEAHFLLIDNKHYQLKNFPRSNRSRLKQKEGAASKCARDHFGILSLENG